MNDSFARGCLWALLLSVPLWLLIAWAAWGIARAFGAIDG